MPSEIRNQPGRRGEKSRLWDGGRRFRSGRKGDVHVVPAGTRGGPGDDQAAGVEAQRRDDIGEPDKRDTGHADTCRVDGTASAVAVLRQGHAGLVPRGGRQQRGFPPAEACLQGREECSAESPQVILPLLSSYSRANHTKRLCSRHRPGISLVLFNLANNSSPLLK